jgi:hypothetical protein
MSNKQQTAVEWCIDELYKLNVKFLNSRYGNQMTILEYSDCKEQIKKKAKEMEKERIENVWIAALDFGIEKMKGLNTLESKDAFEKFYKTTYGGNK